MVYFRLNGTEYGKLQSATSRGESGKRMATFILSFDVVDSNNGRTSKRIYGDYADYGTAETAANSLLADWDAATDSTFDNVLLAGEIAFLGVAGTSPVFEVADATIETDGVQNRNFKLPSPDALVFISGTNTIDESVGQPWANLMAHFTTGWKFNRDEDYVQTLRGKRAYVNSGKTNLV